MEGHSVSGGSFKDYNFSYSPYARKSQEDESFAVESGLQRRKPPPLVEEPNERVNITKVNKKRTLNSEAIVLKGLEFHYSQLCRAYDSLLKYYNTEKQHLEEAKKALEQLRDVVNFLNFEAYHARKTFRRKMAEILEEYPWYNPILKMEKDVRPDVLLKNGWEYYELHLLPRYFCDEIAQQTTHLTRASPGERNRDTELYNPFTVPHVELGDFGVGVGIYFTIVRCFGLLLLLVALLNIPLLVYYQSDSYSGFKFEGNFLTNSSAICTDVEWVPCPLCDEREWDHTSIARKRFKIGAYLNSTESEALPFVLKNNCSYPGLDYGMWYWFSVFVCLLIGLFVTDITVARSEAQFDENEQTAQDYSVVVTNPDPSASDVNEWRDYFQNLTGHRVTMVTIALDNSKLIRALVERRRIIHLLRSRLLFTKVHDDPRSLQPAYHPNRILRLAEELGRKKESERPTKKLSEQLVMKFTSVMGNDELTLVNKALQLQESIETKHLNYRHKVKQVFVTFEKEEGKSLAQRKLQLSPFVRRKGYVSEEIVAPAQSQFSRLTLMSYDFDTFSNEDASSRKTLSTTNSLPPSIRGTIPNVEEAGEPASIRWMDIGSDAVFHYMIYAFNFCVIIALALVLTLIVNETQDSSFGYAFFVYFWVSVAGPAICKLLHNNERHNSDTSYNILLFLKYFCFKIVLPFNAIFQYIEGTSMVSDEDGSLILVIWYLFFFDIIVEPVLNVLAFREMFYHHYLCPRAATQEECNLLFLKSCPPSNIMNSYAEMYKVFVLTISISFLFPGALFLGSFYMFMQYYLTRYNLMRHWAPSTGPGLKTVRLIRLIGSCFCLVASVTIVSNNSASWPFDNICELKDSSETSGSITNFGLYEVDGQEVEVSQDTIRYGYCDQRRSAFKANYPAAPADDGVILSDGLKYEFKSRSSSSQEQVTAVLSYSGLLFTIIYFSWHGANRVLNFIMKLKTPPWKSNEVLLDEIRNDKSSSIQYIDFSNVNEIFGYIPQVIVTEVDHPMLLCDIDGLIDTNYIGFDLSSRKEYEDYNVIYDIVYDGMKRKRGETSNLVSVDNGQQLNDHDVPEGYENTSTQEIFLPCFAIVKHWPRKWIFENDLESDD